MVKNKTITFLILLALVSGFSYHYFFLDDAFISLRYAENLGEHGQLSYNLGERTEGITNIGYTLLLSVLHAYENPLVSVKLLSLLGFIASIILVYKITDNKAVAALLAIDGFYSVWASDGLETSIFISLLLLAYYLAEKQKFSWSGTLLGISSWFRLDALVFSILMFAKYKDKKLLLALVPFALLELFRLWYFGALIPNTYFAKLAFYNFLVPLSEKPIMLLTKLGILAVIYPLPILGIIKKRFDPVTLFPLALLLIYGWSPIGGLRYIAYGVPFLFFYLKRIPKAYFVYVLLLSAGLHLFFVQQNTGLAVFKETSLEIAELNTEKLPIAIADAGLLGFYQKDTRVIDILGLNTHESVIYIANQNFQGLCEFIDSQNPAYVILSQDAVSLEISKCIKCELIQTRSYAPLVYPNATLRIFKC
ncbi:MAG: hypothetical protein GOU99_03970 [Candidatus Altiarchaeota archaeon]|nr:hypothetical protein [Candidatus Altiarchaeota archaeon]